MCSSGVVLLLCTYIFIAQYTVGRQAYSKECGWDERGIGERCTDARRLLFSAHRHGVRMSSYFVAGVEGVCDPYTDMIFSIQRHSALIYRYYYC